MNLSEALSIFSDHLPDIRKACVENVRHLQSAPHRAMDIDTDEWSAENIHLDVEHYRIERDSEPMLRVIKRIDGRKRHHNSLGQITDADIERAREYPIKELWETLVGPVRHKMSECPFHPDSTPSVSVGKYNRFKCFGCDESGDTIDLYMKVNNVDFIQAVRALQ